MAHTIELDQSNVATEKQAASTQAFSPQMISTLTPICLALIGGVIGMVVLIRGGSDAGFGLASTAIAGTAGLAQPQQEKCKGE